MLFQVQFGRMIGMNHYCATLTYGSFDNNEQPDWRYVKINVSLSMRWFLTCLLDVQVV